MSVFLQPIYTQTLTGASYVVTFNSIPQTFTDLMLKISTRTDYASTWDGGPSLYFNGDNAGSTYSETQIRGDGSTAISQRFYSNSITYFGIANGATSTANTFTNGEIYIPNYRSSNYKPFLIDLVAENQTVTAYQTMDAGLWRSTSAITSISFYGGSGNYVTGSTFSLYGVLRQGI